MFGVTTIRWCEPCLSRYSFQRFYTWELLLLHIKLEKRVSQWFQKTLKNFKFTSLQWGEESTYEDSVGLWPVKMMPGVQVSLINKVKKQPVWMSAKLCFNDVIKCIIETGKHPRSRVYNTKTLKHVVYGRNCCLLKHCFMSEVYKSHIETKQQYLQNAFDLGVCSLSKLLALKLETIPCICGPSNGKQSWYSAGMLKQCLHARSKPLCSFSVLRKKK